jgi:predicted kinase
MRGGGTGSPDTRRPGEVVLVCGPPCAGKTTWVRQHAGPGDQVIDFDAICRRLGSPSRYDHPPRIRALAKMVRSAMEQQATAHPGRTYVIRSLPDPEDRAAVAERLGARVVMLATPAEEAMRRAAADDRPAWTAAAIRSWWDRYRPSPADEQE